MPKSMPLRPFKSVSQKEIHDEVVKMVKRMHIIGGSGNGWSIYDAVLREWEKARHTDAILEGIAAEEPPR